jgi:spermidine synthase
VGLGIGVLAAYGRETDHYRIYELVPSVLDIAKKYFWYLTDTKAKVSFSLGDGRLSLERDPPQQFDMLGIDTFSSDSIPMHLMTLEALRVYQKQIKPDGAIVYNVTNRLINLAPMVKLLAEQEGMTAILISDTAARGDYYQTDFVIVTRNPQLIQDPRLASATPIAPIPGLKVWTDHHNNLFDVLR